MAHGDRSVDVFVRKLRQKLEMASPGWRYIHTHFGIGYRFDPETDEIPVLDADPRVPSRSSERRTARARVRLFGRRDDAAARDVGGVRP